MPTEQERILKLLEDKKINADEAARLLDAVGGETPGSPRFVKIRVYNRDSGNVKANITLPVSLIRWGMQFVPESAQMKLNEQHISFEQIHKALESHFQGRLVEVEDEEKGERVEVTIE